ncbi:MAG: helix-turn-helix transcriptional regulator [Bacteroidia bacterium]
MVSRFVLLLDSGSVSKDDYLDLELFFKGNKLKQEGVFAVMQNLGALYTTCKQELSIEVRVYLSPLDHAFVHKQTTAAMHPPATPADFDKLTTTEKAIALLTAMNNTQSEIADKILISSGSVNTLRKRTYKKLNIPGNVHHLRDYVVKQGWVRVA